ncbi:MAG: PHP domain-containing protein [Clostridia bacterium]|nr:PHP domain-containing protein [Clostridia bacterium]
MKQICDLHTHSVFSDGTYTPTEIICSAIDIGLSAVALCDHNTVDGIPEFLAAAKGKNIEAIAGSEFSVDYNGKELHLLGLYIPEDKLNIISDLMIEGHELKEKSNIDLVNALNKIGYTISYAEVKSKSPNGKINRAHIAAELTRKGYTESIAQAFKTVLSKKAGYYIEPKRLDVYETIEFVKSIGAVPVLAHPFLNLSEAELRAFIPSAQKCGLVGMECYYSLYDEERTNKSVSIATEFGLKPSGGSDFHGSNKPDIRLGVGKGNLEIPYEWVKAIKP